MTCIVGVTDGTEVVLGGDSAAISIETRELEVRANRKVFRRQGYVFGYTGSFRMGQILRYQTRLPRPGADLERFMATAFVDAVRKSFRRAGFHRRRDDGQELGGPFLVGVAGRLFIILEDFQAAMPAHPFAAVGAGSGMAMGALHALAGYADLTPAERARRALTAAEACCWAVRRPFHLVGSPIASGPPPPAPAATATAPAHSVRDKKIS